MIEHSWSFQGFPVIRLESAVLRVDVVPELGGKVLQIEHRELRRYFLWHNPRQRLARLPCGTSYDDHFYGGWDALLPNDLAETVGGERLVDHGELWTTPLCARLEEDAVRMIGDLPITPLRFEKRVALGDGDTFHVDYALTNIGHRRLDLLFKLHPALRISPGAEIRVPAAQALVADPAFSRFRNSGPFRWPEGADAGERQDRADIVPAMEGTSDFFYLTDLKTGQCTLAHQQEDWQFQLVFDPTVFRSVWVFASFGGWRGLETLILEPSTTWPISLVEAAAQGQCLTLEPGQVLTTTVDCRVGRYQAVR